MHFSTFNDVQAPIDWVFRQFTDFPAFERQALRRGADIKRLNPALPDGLGAVWDVRFQFRGKGPWTLSSLQLSYLQLPW